MWAPLLALPKDPEKTDGKKEACWLERKERNIIQDLHMRENFKGLTEWEKVVKIVSLTWDIFWKAFWHKLVSL